MPGSRGLFNITKQKRMCFTITMPTTLVLAMKVKGNLIDLVVSSLLSFHCLFVRALLFGGHYGYLMSRSKVIGQFQYNMCSGRYLDVMAQKIVCGSLGCGHLFYKGSILLH